MNNKRVAYTEEFRRGDVVVTVYHFTPTKTPIPDQPPGVADEAIRLFGSQREENQ